MVSETRIATVADLQSEGALLVEDGNHGEYRPRPNEFVEDGVPFIRAADMEGGRVLFESASRISESALARIRKGIGKPGDILLSHKGTVGKVAKTPSDCEPFVCSPQTTFWRVIDERKIDRTYLFVYLKSRDFETQLDSRKRETDMADYVSLTNQRTLKVALPPLPEQRAIAHVLGTLDDKIELNRRMNETLEAMAQALFKSWFVDAMRNGLPERWRESTLGEVCEFSYGKALKEEIRSPGSVPVYGSNGQIGWHNETLVKGPGIVVGRKGNPGIVTWAATDFFPIDTTFYVLPKRECRSLYFLFFALRAQDLASLSADSAVPGLNRNMAYMSELVIPPTEVLDAFDDQVRPMFERIHQNNEESRTLAALRDSLLPKLLSGKVRIAPEKVEKVRR